MALRDELQSVAVESEPRVQELLRVIEHLQRDLVRSKDRTERLVEVVYQAAHDAMLTLGPVPPVVPPMKDKRTRGTEVALWHLTDWQGAKVTTSYNSDVMRERVLRFCDKAQRITEIHRQAHPIKDVYIMLGGDLCEGLWNFPTQPFEIDSTVFDQYVTVAMLLVDVVRRALSVYEHVTVIGEWGNHGRLGSKRDVVPRSDNLDRMTYELARRLLAGEKRLTWQDCPEDIQRVHIPDPTGKSNGYRALLMHGDEVGRSGFAAPHAWQAAGNRWKAGAYAWPFQDIYLGHYHRHAQEPLSDGMGAIYWTGSTESDNRYARDSMAASGVPSQRLHFVDPERGGRITAVYQVWLDK